MTPHEEILELLTNKLRTITADQVARTWFSHSVAPQKIALQCLRRQERQGLLSLETAMVHPPLELAAPLFIWQPCQTPEPDCGALAWRTQSRWKAAPVRTVLVRATDKARALTGGALGQRMAVRATERSHDATLAELFLSMRVQFPERARAWIPEDALEPKACPGGKNPDALLRQGGAETIVELLGKAYSRARILGLHRAWRERNYELW